MFHHQCKTAPGCGGHRPAAGVAGTDGHTDCRNFILCLFGKYAKVLIFSQIGDDFSGGCHGIGRYEAASGIGSPQRNRFVSVDVIKTTVSPRQIPGTHIFTSFIRHLIPFLSGQKILLQNLIPFFGKAGFNFLLQRFQVNSEHPDQRADCHRIGIYFLSQFVFGHLCEGDTDGGVFGGLPGD